jgi:hypothetical protein
MNNKFEKGGIEIFLFVAVISVLIAGVMGIRINVGGLPENEEGTIDFEEVATTTQETPNNQ